MRGCQVQNQIPDSEPYGKFHATSTFKSSFIDSEKRLCAL